MPHLPLRTCLISRTKTTKTALFRLVRTVDNIVVIDYNYNIQGRGAYLLKSRPIIEKARKSAIVERRLKAPVDPSLYDQLLESL